MVRLLVEKPVEKEADVEAKILDGDTALHQAATTGHIVGRSVASRFVPIGGENIDDSKWGRPVVVG